MRYSTWLCSAVFLTIAPLSAFAADSDLVVVKCQSGLATVTARSPWHTNDNAPWIWDKGSLISKDSTQVKFKGPTCEGTIKAYIASGSQVKGPINTPVK